MPKTISVLLRSYDVYRDEEHMRIVEVTKKEWRGEAGSRMRQEFRARPVRITGSNSWAVDLDEWLIAVHENPLIK